MEPWNYVYEQLKKEKPVLVLIFIFHFYYGVSIRYLSSMFDLKPDRVSKYLHRTINRIRLSFTKDGNKFGTDENGTCDGHLVSADV